MAFPTTWGQRSASPTWAVSSCKYLPTCLKFHHQLHIPLQSPVKSALHSFRILQPSGGQEGPARGRGEGESGHRRGRNPQTSTISIQLEGKRAEATLPDSWGQGGLAQGTPRLSRTRSRQSCVRVQLVQGIPRPSPPVGPASRHAVP